MKIIFAGTPTFALPTLSALIESNHEIIAVYTQPDRPAARGQKIQESPVKTLALQHHLPIEQPLDFKSPAVISSLENYAPDVMVVVAYGLLLPESVLRTPKFGCINVHASLLPRWRGAAPIQHAILMGDAVTGVTIMQMDKGLDTGAMLHRVNCNIESHDTAESLQTRLATLGAHALLETLDKIEKKTLTFEPQDSSLSTYAPKIKKEDASINWENSALIIDRLIRAYHPWPVAFTALHDQIIRIHEAKNRNEKNDSAPGTIIAANAAGIDVNTGDGILRILKLQFPGGKIVSAADVLNARRAYFAVGNSFTKPS